jgi:hypothetical protein
VGQLPFIVPGLNENMCVIFWIDNSVVNAHYVFGISSGTIDENILTHFTSEVSLLDHHMQ